MLDVLGGEFRDGVWGAHIVIDVEHAFPIDHLPIDYDVVVQSIRIGSQQDLRITIQDIAIHALSDDGLGIVDHVIQRDLQHEVTPTRDGKGVSQIEQGSLRIDGLGQHGPCDEGFVHHQGCRRGCILDGGGDEIGDHSDESHIQFIDRHIGERFGNQLFLNILFDLKVARIVLHEDVIASDPFEHIGSSFSLVSILSQPRLALNRILSCLLDAPLVIEAASDLNFRRIWVRLIERSMSFSIKMGSARSISM